MKNKLVGALVVATLVAFVASACSSKTRDFGAANGAGGQSTAGKSGSGPDERGGNQASGGTQVSAGLGGDGLVVGGAPAEAGAAGAGGGACQRGDCTSCVGATPAPGTPCGECGTYVCNPDQATTSCSDPKHNACGGCAKLVAAPGTVCGDCGQYECAADKESVSCKDLGKNACGGCGVLSNAPNSSCGACGNWACTADKKDVKCSGLNANACGGCGTLANAPGLACGQCGKYACSADKASTACTDPGKNACGGCTALTGTLNAACGNGNCGKLSCSADKSSLTCTGDVPNACGGCSALTPAGATKDGSCGTCGRKWACNADLNSLSCAGTSPNVCGGCTAIAGTVGASCGACLVTACSADKNSLDCNSQCTAAQVCVSGLNQCKTPDCSAPNSCGMSDGAGSTCTNTKGKCPAKPNATGSCSGSSCAYVCMGNSNFAETLSCSTSAEPACGSWNFESNTTEGWSVKTDNTNGNNAASGALYLATPPGPGAGVYSLALNVDGTALSAGLATISLDFCPGAAPATGIQGAFHVMVWFKPTDGNGAVGGPGYTYLDNGVAGPDINCPAGAWFDVPSNAVSGVSVKHVDVTIGGIEHHKGVLYFDNMHFD
jgi:hypothetical protein